MSCRRKARLLLHHRGQWIGPAPLATNACQSCVIKHSCTTGKQRRISRWGHEHVLEAVQRRLDEHPEEMRQRRETVEHPFGTIKARMGATHFLMKTLPRVASEMALHVLAYKHDEGDEHHGCPAADGGDEGITSPKTPASSKARQDPDLPQRFDTTKTQSGQCSFLNTRLKAVGLSKGHRAPNPYSSTS